MSKIVYSKSNLLKIKFSVIIQKLLVLGVLKTYPEFNCANLVWNRFEIDFEISSVKIRNVVRNYSIKSNFRIYMRSTY